MFSDVHVSVHFLSQLFEEDKIEVNMDRLYFVHGAQLYIPSRVNVGVANYFFSAHANDMQVG